MPDGPAGRHAAAVRRWLVRIAIAAAVLLVVAQAVPYGRSHDNPRPTAEPAWDSAATRQLAAGACFDCHSDLTTWPWYSNIAPVSWLVQRDVDQGRRILNFSEWDRPQEADPGEVAEVVREGEMPPLQYKPLHADARLSAAERERLARGLERTLQSSPAG